MIIPNYFEDFSTQHINLMPRRNYFIPYASLSEYKNSYSRTDSSSYIDLNGQWDFHYFENVREIETPFWLSRHKNELDYNQLKVPSVWQLSGYGQIQYTNVELPIPFDPPYAPYKNPAGLYHRSFTLNKDELHDYHLNFEGVDASFYVWVNDEFIGYSQISHSNSEFDLSNTIKEGKNDLSVLVVQWGDMTYLEDQDKFRYSGIFRDVYLLKRAKERLNHFEIETEVSENLEEAKIKLEVKDTEKIEEISYQLFNPQGEEVVSDNHFVKDKLTLELENPFLWNAETPNLYKLVLYTNKEVYVQKIGVRQVEVKNNQILVNHQPVRLIGVNHHDTHPKTGATTTIDNHKKDLQLMKKLNFNAVRTAHYPKTGEFYELCDELGFYVMSEADLECHEVVDLYGLGGNENYNMIAEDPLYEKSMIERTEANIIPNINFSSIIMWSTGNESGYGSSIEAAMRRGRELDGSRLHHYEGYWERDRENPNYSAVLHDVWSRMYPDVDEIEDLYLSDPIEKPFLLCEYAHAMGNGPGDLKKYHNCMEKHPEFVGVFVWEWADHAVDINRGTNTTPAYRHGGDFNEYPSSGNFCIDGLVYPDRTPHTGAYEHRQVFRPVVLVDENVANRKITLKNRYAFSTLSDKIDIDIEFYSQQGELQATEKIQSPHIEPYATRELTVAALERLEEENIYALRLVYKAKDTNTELGFDTVQIKEFKPELKNHTSASDFEVFETNSLYKIIFKNREIHFSKATGAIEQLIDQKRKLLKKGSTWEIWRAPTDNDRKIRIEWEKANYQHTNIRIYKTQLNNFNEKISISFEGSINAVARQNIMKFTATWTIKNDGEISLELKGQKNMVMPFLPRFGLCIPLAKDFENVTYIGNGPFESYPDKKNLSYLAQFSGTVVDFYEPYITPQENGSRNQLKYLNVSDENSRIEVIAKNQLSFNISHFSTEQLTKVTHRDKLTEEPFTYLHLDYQQSGLGSNSCGPELEEKYRLNDPEFTFRFTLTF